MFLDPTSYHCNVSFSSRRSYYINFSKNSKMKPILLSKIKGKLIESVLWNPTNTSSVQTGEILLGMRCGEIFVSTINDQAQKSANLVNETVWLFLNSYRILRCIICQKAHRRSQFVAWSCIFGSLLRDRRNSTSLLRPQKSFMSLLDLLPSPLFFEKYSNQEQKATKELFARPFQAFCCSSTRILSSSKARLGNK